MTYVIMGKTGTYPAWKKVTTIAHIFPTIDFLYTAHGLTPDTRINVFHTKRVTNSKHHWKGYRTNFKHIFNGTVAEFGIKCVKYYQDKIWKKKGVKQDESSNILPSEYRGTESETPRG